MKKTLKILLKVIVVLLAIAIIGAAVIYFTVLRYPQIKDDPKIGKWYRLESSAMMDSEGNAYHALFKKGSENKVMVYFAGGGVSINEDTAKYDTYNTQMVWPDYLANITMNMGGLASDVDGNPFKDWTFILFPYATGDFHSGTGEFAYIDKDGKEKKLYHNGYINFTEAMDLVSEYAGIDNPEAVVVTGYSAGGWGAALLADDVFSTYFPNTDSKVLLVDSALALNDNWHGIAENVWQSPEHIISRIHTDNIVLDSLTALHEKHGDDVTILFGCSTRDGSLGQVQQYFQTGVIDTETGEMPMNEESADAFQQTLKDFTVQAGEQANAHFFIWDGMAWYDDPRNMTSHTIISVPFVFAELNDSGSSVAQWLMDAVNGTSADFGIELLDKVYPKTE